MRGRGRDGADCDVERDNLRGYLAELRGAVGDRGRTARDCIDQGRVYG